MSNKNEDYYNELLDKFLSGVITEEESEELQVAANKDPELQEALAKHIEARANIRIAGEADLKKKLTAAYDELPVSSDAKPRQSISYFRWAAVAASIIGLAFAIFYLFPKSPTTFQLADYINETPSINIRGNQSNNFAEAWKTAELAYQDGKYNEAIEAFGQLDNYKEDAKAHAGKIAVFKGLGYLQLKEHDKAIANFKLVSETNPLSEDARWYIALAYLDKGSKEKAQTLLQTIVDDKKHYKHTQAIEILNNFD